MENDIKPCPFCGSNKIHESQLYYECLNCLSFGPSENSPFNKLNLTAKQLWNLENKRYNK